MSPPPDRKLAHELSNQLGIVISYAELLLEELDAADPNRRDLAAIDRASRRLQQLFEGVTSFDEVSDDARDQNAKLCTRSCRRPSRWCTEARSPIPRASSAELFPFDPTRL